MWLGAKSLQLCPTLCALWTVAHQAPLPMGFPRPEYWSGLPHPPPGSNSNLSRLAHWQMGSLPLEPPGKQNDCKGICCSPRDGWLPRSCGIARE